MEQNLDNLKFRLKDLRHKNAYHQWFIPQLSLCRAMSKDVIWKALQDAGTETYRLDETAEYILRNGIKIFAILVLIDQVTLISRFISEQLSDQHLPFDLVTLYIEPLRPFAHEIYERQWEFIAPTFYRSTINRSFNYRFVLPFTKNEYIGSGGFSHVYRIKLDHSHQQLEGPFQDMLVRKEFRSAEIHTIELESLAILSHLRHPNILEVLASYTYKGNHNLIFPLAEGGTLRDLFTKDRQITPFKSNEAFLIALARLSSAIEHVHNVADCHKNLVPSNILISKGTLILAGLSMLRFKASPESSKTVFMHPYYSAPENADLDLQMSDVRRPSDIWSFGCIIAEAATYMILGPVALVEFENTRKFQRGNGVYYRFHCGSSKPNEAVNDWLSKLENQSPRTCRMLIELARRMLSMDEKKRPTAKAVTARLRLIALHEVVDAVDDLFHKVLVWNDSLNALIEQKRLEAWKYAFGMLDQESAPDFHKDVEWEQTSEFDSILDCFFQIREHLKSISTQKQSVRPFVFLPLGRFNDRLGGLLDGRLQEKSRNYFKASMVEVGDEAFLKKIRDDEKGLSSDEEVRTRDTLKPMSELGIERGYHESSIHRRIIPPITVSHEAVTSVSRISNDGSAPASVVFSLQSVPSTAMTGNSLLTDAEMKKATDELISIFLDDQELGTLYRVARDNERIGPERFARNFKRLLKVFSMDLKEEIRDAVDLELTNFISSKARIIATRIRRIYEPVLVSSETAKDPRAEGLQTENARKATVEKPVSGSTITEELPNEEGLLSKEDIEVSSDDEEAEDANNKKLVALVAQSRNFIEESNAFKKLRKDFRDFVMPPPRQAVPEPAIASVSCHGLPSDDPMPNPPLTIAQKIYRKVLALFSSVGLRENDTPPGHQRIRWTNSRGKKLYDDYVEHEPGALQALQNYLNTSAYRSRATSERGQGRTSAPFISSPTFNNSSIGASSSDSNHIANKTRAAPIESSRSSQAQENLELGENSTLHLLSCLEKGRYGVNLHQELVTHITDDQQLFRTLRQSYHRHRGKFRASLSLRTVHGIYFMKFAYGGSRYLDVRCHDDICEPGKPCDCIPPADRVRPKGTEYECHPIPSKLSPPVGPRLMMDFFINPDGITPDATFVIQQLPKRTSGELRSQSFELTEAWGIYYKEDWDWVKIWWALAIGFFPPSLLFGILWGILKKDIQGAFSVSSWWMTGATILVGIVGSCTWT